MKLKRANSYALHALIYMTRHMTQLPVTLQTISKAQGIPYRQLVTIFHQLSDAGIVTHAGFEQSGYVFKRRPSEVSLLELFELIEGHPLFEECVMKHTDCPGTPESCSIYAAWKEATLKISKKLSETSIDKAAWTHPDHSLRHDCFGTETAEKSSSC